MTQPEQPAPVVTPPEEDDGSPEVVRGLDRRFVIRQQGRSFALYAGLLDLAHQQGLKGISTTIVQIPSELNGMTAIVHATVDTERGTFMGLGDANPANVTRMMVPHLIRMAETRAKARALRDATNVGVAAFEELGDGGGGSDAHGDGSVQESAWPRGGGGGAAPRPVMTGPARPEQLAAIARLMVAAGETVDTEGMTAAKAGQEIVRLQDAARANGAAGGQR